MPATLDLRRGQVVGDASRRAVNLNTLTKAAAGTTYAPIASPVFTGDPKAPTPAPGDNDTSVATTAFVHSAIPAAGHLPGTATNDSAAAGQVGEYLAATVLAGSAISLTNGTTFNLTTLALTAGDWDVDGILNLTSSGALLTNAQGWCSLSSATPPDAALRAIVTIAAMSEIAIVTAKLRVSLAATATVYLSGFPQFSGTCTACGQLQARRVR